jgi:hypothetical protein
MLCFFELASPKMVMQKSIKRILGRYYFKPIQSITLFFEWSYDP